MQHHKNKMILLILSCLCIWQPAWALNATDVTVGGLDAWTLSMCVSMGVIASCCVGAIVYHLLCKRPHVLSVDNENDWHEAGELPEVASNSVVPAHNEA
jgi:hypothetical protein